MLPPRYSRQDVQTNHSLPKIVGLIIGGRHQRKWGRGYKSSHIFEKWTVQGTGAKTAAQGRYKSDGAG